MFSASMGMCTCSAYKAAPALTSVDFACSFYAPPVQEMMAHFDIGLLLTAGLVQCDVAVGGNGQ